MDNHRLRHTNSAESSGPSNHNAMSYSLMLHGINPASNPFMNQGGSSFDFGELEEAIAFQGVNNDTKATLYTATTTPTPTTTASAASAARPATATLEMFPSWPIRFQQATTGSSKSGSSDSESALNTISTSKTETHLESEYPISSRKTPLNQEMASDSCRAGPSQATTSTKQPLDKRQGGTRSGKVLDAKTVRRLAQNREAARKSRLRKKAYVQQLETSRIKLAQLEQDLQRARAQGLFLGGGGGASANISSGAAIFDMEYARWLEDDQRHMTELRAALQAHLSDRDLQVIVDAYISHYDDIFRLKSVAAKTDVFHLITGTWTSPAERCFLWMGGFRPSDLIKMLTTQLDPLTQQQIMGIYSLQQSSQQAEEALSQGLDQLQHSLVDTIAGTTVADGMHQMAVALGKLSNLEGFVRQADNLRQQTLHQLRRILTVRQGARCFLVIGEYYSRLRALSHLWASRPREGLMGEENINIGCHTTTDLQMVQPSHFSPF